MRPQDKIIIWLLLICMTFMVMAFIDHAYVALWAGFIGSAVALLGWLSIDGRKKE